MDAADAAPPPQADQPEQQHRAPSQFPDKLMMLLEKGTATEALWWLRDVGTIKGAFAINRKAFTAKVLDLAFNGNKWPSITRNLNRWGYRHVSYPNLPPHTTAYHNPLFQPNRPDLLKTMTQNKSQAKAAIQQIEMKKISSSPSPSPAGNTGSIPGRPGVMSTPAVSDSSGQLLSFSAQPTLRSSLLLAGVPTAAQRHQQPPPQPSDETSRRAAGTESPSARTFPTDQGHSSEETDWSPLTDDPQNAPNSIIGNSSSSSAGFELFSDALLANMTANLDSQAMLQSILSRQGGLDALAQPQAQSQSQVPDFLRAGDAPFLEQLQLQEALLTQLDSPQPQTQLLNANQEQELLHMLEMQQQHQTSAAPQLMASQQLGFADRQPLAIPPATRQQPQHPPPPSSLGQLQQVSSPHQHQQQSPLLHISPAAAAAPVHTAPTDLSQQHLQHYLNAPAAARYSPSSSTGADAITVGGDASQASSTLQQQEALINELIRRRQQEQHQQQNPQQPHSPGGNNEDCKTS